MHWTYDDVVNLPASVFVELTAWLAERHRPDPNTDGN